MLRTPLRGRTLLFMKRSMTFLMLFVLATLTGCVSTESVNRHGTASVAHEHDDDDRPRVTEVRPVKIRYEMP
jgi:hypothetical protein